MLDFNAYWLHTCQCFNSWHNPLLANLLNSLYMVAITFLSVGYGDFVPSTYCGRGLAVLSGLMVSSHSLYVSNNTSCSTGTSPTCLVYRHHLSASTQLCFIVCREQDARHS